MSAPYASAGLRSLVGRASALLIVVAMLMVPIMANSCGRNLVCDEFGARTVPIAEEEEVKHACTEGFQPLMDLGAPMLRDQAPALFDERIEAATHGEVAVPPPKAVA